MQIINRRNEELLLNSIVVIKGTIIKNRKGSVGREMYVYLGEPDTLRYIRQEESKPETVQTLITSILSKGYEVNTQTHHQVFVDYAGHVNKLSLRVYEGGSCTDKDRPDIEHSCYIDGGESSRDQLRRILEVITNLL
jgi:hypothetical protein